MEAVSHAFLRGYSEQQEYGMQSNKKVSLLKRNFKKQNAVF
jgi:hypothetical protein